MVESMRFPTQVLFAQANRVIDHGEENRRDHGGLDDALGQAGGSWPGVIGSAVEQVRTAWASQHEAMDTAVGGHARWIMDATNGVIDIDEGSAGGFGHTASQGQ